MRGVVCAGTKQQHIFVSQEAHSLGEKKRVVKKKTSIVERRARLSSVVEIKTRCYRYSGEGEFPFRGWE